MLSLKIERRKL